MSRISLTAPINFYVAPTGGSDSNDGLTLSTPFATGNKAVNLIASAYDPCGFQPTINLLPDNTATHAPITLQNYIDAGLSAQTSNARILGYGSDITKCVVADAVTAICGVGVRSAWCIENLTVTGGSIGIEADFGTNLYLKNPRFKNCVNGLITVFGSHVEFLATTNPLFTLAGSFTNVFYCDQKSQMIFQIGRGKLESGTAVSGALVTSTFQSRFYYAVSGYDGAFASLHQGYNTQIQANIQGAPNIPTGSVASYCDASSVVG